MEIVAIVNDWRAEAAGGMEAAIIMWEACIIPSLLQGAGTWTQISAKTEQRLNSLQQWFVRLLLRVGQGAPLASLGWETGLLDMRLRVWREKVMLVMHLRQLGEDSLASRIYKEQVAKDWPGLAKEAKEICQKLKIEDCNKTSLSKKEFKAMLKSALCEKDKEMLQEEAMTKKKCEMIMKDKYGKKEYISKEKLDDVRNCFKSRVGMMPFAGNFSRDKKYAKTNWLCRCGTEKEQEAHLKNGNCPIYADIRADYGDLEDLEDLVSFFTRVLERRDLLDRGEEQEEDLTLAVGNTADVCRMSLSSSQSSHVHGLE